jgi:hypothetical protein
MVAAGALLMLLAAAAKSSPGPDTLVAKALEGAHANAEVKLAAVRTGISTPTEPDDAVWSVLSKKERAPGKRSGSVEDAMLPIYDARAAQVC